MKRLVTLVMALGAGIFLFAAPSRAQSPFDVSVGYSYFHLGGTGGPGLNQNGVSGSVAYNFHDYLAAVGDFGGYHGSVAGVSLNTYTYMFGPRISAHKFEKFTPFAQLLVGGGHLTAGGGGGSSNSFAYSVGGGVDVGVLPHLALRPQVDYVGLHNSGGTASSARVSVSAVIHF